MARAACFLRGVLLRSGPLATPPDRVAAAGETGEPHGVGRGFRHRREHERDVLAALAQAEEPAGVTVERQVVGVEQRPPSDRLLKPAVTPDARSNTVHARFTSQNESFQSTRLPAPLNESDSTFEPENDRFEAFESTIWSYTTGLLLAVLAMSSQLMVAPRASQNSPAPCGGEFLTCPLALEIPGMPERAHLRRFRARLAAAGNAAMAFRPSSVTTSVR